MEGRVQRSQEGKRVRKACGACIFLKKKCGEGCVFAPYFCSQDMGAAQFSKIHHIFGASNFSKLLQKVPEDKRIDAVANILFEAEARINNPIHGCLENVFALRNEIAQLNAEIDAGYAELAASGDLQFFLSEIIGVHNYRAEASIAQADPYLFLSGHNGVHHYRAEASINSAQVQGKELVDIQHQNSFPSNLVQGEANNARVFYY